MMARHALADVASLVGEPTRAVAHALEALGLLATAPGPSPRAVTADMSPEKRAFRAARSCYDHLAGSLGAAVLDRALEQRWVVRISGSRALRVTERGTAELSGRGS